MPQKKRIYCQNNLARKSLSGNAATGNDHFEIYKKMDDDVQAIYRSRLLTEILLSLNEGSKSFYNCVKLPEARLRLIPAQNSKQSSDRNKEHEYFLTSAGKIVASGIADSFVTFWTINKFKHFWLRHYLEGIPSPLLKEIGCLYESEVLKDRGMKILNVYNNQLKMLKEADHIYGISSVVTKGDTDSISERVKEGDPVELIVPLHVAEELKRSPYLKNRSTERL